MTGEAIICRMGKHQEIPGADNIVKVELFGETIVTQKTSKEGVCIRIEKHLEGIQIFKNKSFIFKVLEGIAKEDDKYVDLEEIS